MRAPIIFAVLVAACAGRVDSPASPDTAAARPTMTPTGAKRVLSLRGSNTLGIALAPKLVRAFLTHEGATDIAVHDEMKEPDRMWLSANLGGPLWVEIYTPGTKYGFDSLAVGYCDVVLASRPVSAEELEKLAPQGDLTAPASENVVAMDGIAVIVNANNPVDRLSMSQLEQVFAGTVTNWSSLGGPSLPIHVFARDHLSGTHDAFVSLVMNGTAIKAEKAFEDSEELARAVAASEGGIGFVGLPYVQQTKALAIQDGGAQSMLPTPFTVATEDYALSRRLFFYVPSAPKSPLTRKLVEFALSDEGQAIVADAGFVPLSLRAEGAGVPAKAPAAYAKLASGATRLSVDFRFRQGSSDIDTKARHDLDRLTRYLASPVNRGRHLALVGFADAQGTDPVNQELAKQRADAVAALLKERGVVTAQVTSFGSALPIAPNDTPAGRARNRRVEVWLR